jgi:c-di-GMP-binding flagellar brake protein YcgR
MAPESQRQRRAPGRNLKTPTKFRRLGKRTFSGTKGPLDIVALLGHDSENDPRDLSVALFGYGKDPLVASNRRSAFRQAMTLHINLRVSGMRAPVAATLVDLSSGGGMVAAKTALKAHTPVEFDLPRDGQPHLRLPGTIRKVTFMPRDRNFRYAVEFANLDDDTREALHRFITFEQRRELSATRRGDELRKPKTTTDELRAHRRIDVEIPVKISIVDVPGVMEATLIDVSTGGVRVLIAHVLRQEWAVQLRFTLPSDVLRSGNAFEEIKVQARALPGIKQSRGKYIQSLVWLNPDPAVTAEIHRFVQAAHLVALRRV